MSKIQLPHDHGQNVEAMFDHMPGSDAFQMVSDVSVSYTHLDVYKRQVLEGQVLEQVRQEGRGKKCLNSKTFTRPSTGVRSTRKRPSTA